MTKTVKFQLNELLGIGMTMVVLGIGLAYGLQVSGDVRDDMGTADCAARTDGYTTYSSTAGTCSNGSNSVSVGTENFVGSNDSMVALAKLPNKLPTIMTVIVAAVIIGILVTYLWSRFR